MAKKFKEIILHVGLNKTGTSSIQFTMTQFRDDFLSHAQLLYPSSFRPNHSLEFLHYFEDLKQRNPLRPMLEKKSAEEKEALQMVFDSFVQEMEETSAERLLLCGEMISTMNVTSIQKLKTMLDDYTDQYSIVFVLRNPISWTNSVIQELVKSGYLLEDLYKNPPKQYLTTRFARWQKVFAKNVIKVINYDNVKAKHSNIVRLFCKNCSIDYSFYKWKDQKANTTLTQSSVENINAYNKIHKANLQERSVMEIQRERLPLYEREGEVKFKIPNEVAEKAWELAQDDMEWLKKRFKIHYQF